MGMTIDEAIKYYLNKNIVLTEEEALANTLALNTMRKYQKIREIAFPLQFCSTDKLEHEAIMKICEVLEDGNDD